MLFRIKGESRRASICKTLRRGWDRAYQQIVGHILVATAEIARGEGCLWEARQGQGAKAMPYAKSNGLHRRGAIHVLRRRLWLLWLLRGESGEQRNSQAFFFRGDGGGGGSLFKVLAVEVERSG